MRILELTLASADLDAQSAFWGEVLSLPIHRERGAKLEVHLRSSLIRFESATVGNPRYHFAINIPPRSIDQAAAWVAERHELLSFHDDPDEEEGATIVHTDRGASTFYFLDGGQNVVELISNSYLEDDLDSRFGPDSLLEIAEIGIATADLGRARSAVRATFGASILWGGREGSRLTAIGDDHGVVIVAPIGRGWIPIGLPARPLPTKIVAVGPAAQRRTLSEGPYTLEAVTRADHIEGSG